MRAFRVLLAILASAVLAVAQRPFDALQRWDPAALDAIATLPVQEGGREKPLSAYAAQMLYLVHGRRDMKLDTDGDGKDDVTLSPIEWLLDVWFEPNVAADFPLFRIENVEVLDAIGVPHEGGQRFTLEYVSYRQLIASGTDGKQPVDRLWDLASNYSRNRRPEEQTPLEAHIIRTNQGVDAYGGLITLFAQMHAGYAMQGETLASLFPGKQVLDFADLVAKGSALADLVRRFRNDLENPVLGNAMSVAAALSEVAQRRSTLGLFPPAATRAQDAEWATMPGLCHRALTGKADPVQLGLVRRLQDVFATADATSRSRALLAFREAVVGEAARRGEYGKIELENYYLEASWHYRALHWFLLALIVVAAGWMVPRSRFLWGAGLLATIVPLGMLVTDIALRCAVRGRPPILNLYDTFLFIAAIGVLSAVAAEYFTRRRVAISLAPVFGALLVMLARAFEVESGDDQMAPLQAVLDTNYYLATHVTSINMGYAAGMFASFLGTAWLLLQAIGFRRDDESFHKGVVRATYGVTAFGLVFAVFGTIYGGVWANDSWGRFWGWDPKENGALLICIAQVALIHARMAGWVRDFGFCFFAALTGIVVAFSWFHVNLLGIGLHAYGFSSATKVALFRYYEIQLGLTVLGAVGVWIRRAGVRSSAASTVSMGNQVARG